MDERVVPMIHVPDVQATVDWYSSIGFNIDETYGHDGEGLSFAMVSFGSTQVMFSEGGRASKDRRREVDLYVYTNNVDDLYGRLQEQVEIVEGLHDTFYGMREFIIRDFNRFWITFGQQSAFGALMTGIYEANSEIVRSALNRGELTPETLTSALVIATSRGNTTIVEMLKSAGALLPPEVDERVLQSHVGHYESDHGMKVEVTLDKGTLFATPHGQQRIDLVTINENTFRPIALDGASISFVVEGGNTVGFKLKQGAESILLKRVNRPEGQGPR